MNVNAIELPARAKINLTLDVLGRRADGYHELCSIMQSVELADTVRVTRRGEGVSVSSNLRYLPTDGRNVAVKAANAFFAATGIDGGCEIKIHKRIPVSAGLAGGSTDAAAVLRALNRLYGTGFGALELRTIASGVGADVPFCVTGGTYIARGIGDRLERVTPLADCRFVICKPPVAVSTAKIFARIDSSPTPAKRPDTDAAVAAIAAHDLPALGGLLENVMERVTERDCADVGRIKSFLLSHGALGAVMSGSGPSVFGIFGDRDSARSAAKRLSASYQDTFAVSSAPETEI